MRASDLAVLLIRRKSAPFKGLWALPGGFVNENEPLERAASRELEEETGLVVPASKLQMIGAFGDPGRDPRGHSISVAYVAFRPAETAVVGGDDAVEARWHKFRSLDLSAAFVPRSPSRKKVGASKVAKDDSKVRLAFDHAAIITAGYERICRHLDDPVRDPSFDFIPSRFTLGELRRIYEVVIGSAVTPRLLRAHLIDRGLIVPALKQPAGKSSARLYRWSSL